MPIVSIYSLAHLREVVALFLKLGLTAFGGPAAHIGLMHNEVVKRRKWMDDQQFLDLIGATNLIPGPNSTEMAIHIGFLRAGWAGLIAGGVCFTVPAMLIVLALAWAYVEFGSIVQAGGLLYGVKPVIIAIIVKALIDLGRKAVKDKLTAAVGIGILILYFVGANEIALLFAGGLVVIAITNLQRLNTLRGVGIFFPLAGLGLPTLVVVPFSLPVLFLTFLKIGAVLYGSGYVLLAFLRADFVTQLGWLTDQQLVDAIAVGQITPGPLFTSATFIGYILGGTPGALVATLGIFLPSFFFVVLSNPFIPRIRNSTWVSGLLDGVNVAALGLMAGVTIQLSTTSLVDWLTITMGLISAGLLFRFNFNSTWLIVGGAIVGVISTML
jgi:chromate transporter